MSMEDYPQEYNKSFQTSLVTNAVKDRELLEKCSALSPEDFETPSLQVVFEASRDYLVTTGSMPNHEALCLHSRKVGLNSDGKYVTYLKPEEMPALEQLLVHIEKCEPALVSYLMKELPDYVKAIRASKVIDRARGDAITGQGASNVIGELKKIEEDIDKQFRDERIQFITPAESPGFISMDEWVPPISTGMSDLDTLLSGGVNRKEIGLVSAPSGVGKTNLLIHFCVMAAYQFMHALFFSLELPGKKVRGRASAMVSGIDAFNLLRPVETWEPRDQALLLLAQHKNPVMKRMAFVDSSDMKPTLSSIERNIAEWKAQKIDAGVPEEKCAEVCIDWVDYVQLGFGNNKMEDWERYIMIAQELGFVARRQNVHIWIANQTTRSSESKTVMRMGDTARGYHLNDAMDVSIGANLDEDSRIQEDNDTAMRRGSRGMNLSLNKNRNGDLGLVKAYRGPNLRMFDDEQSYANYLRNTKSVFDPQRFDWDQSDEYADALIRIQTEGLKLEH